MNKPRGDSLRTDCHTPRAATITQHRIVIKVAVVIEALHSPSPAPTLQEQAMLVIQSSANVVLVEIMTKRIPSTIILFPLSIFMPTALYQRNRYNTILRNENSISIVVLRIVIIILVLRHPLYYSHRRHSVNLYRKNQNLSIPRMLLLLLLLR